jgi:hypothetical protein
MPTASTFSAPALPAEFPYRDAFLKCVEGYPPSSKLASPEGSHLLAAIWCQPAAVLEKYHEAYLDLIELGMLGRDEPDPEVREALEEYAGGPFAQTIISALSAVHVHRPGDVINGIEATAMEAA